MVRINLRDFYPFTQEDTYIEVSAEVANMMNAFERAEASYERKIRRYKAYYSLDHKSGIERSILFTSHSPEELYEICRKARQLLRGKHGVGRVIARPFAGKSGNYTRTANRREKLI